MRTGRLIVASLMTYGVMFLCVFGLSALIGAFAWPYVINEWLVFAGRPATVEWWHGALLGFVPGFGFVSIPAAVITWIALLFLGGSGS